jgi:hypothetical protein
MRFLPFVVVFTLVACGPVEETGEARDACLTTYSQDQGYPLPDGASAVAAACEDALGITLLCDASQWLPEPAAVCVVEAYGPKVDPSEERDLSLYGVGADALPAWFFYLSADAGASTRAVVVHALDGSIVADSAADPTTITDRASEPAGSAPLR